MVFMPNGRPVKIETLIRLDRVHKRMVSLFSVTFVVWISSVLLYGVGKQFNSPSTLYVVSNILLVTSLAFIAVTVGTVYIGRVLYDNLIPLVIRAQEDLDQTLHKDSDQAARDLLGRLGEYTH